jgi:DNA polymerase-3 subunit gamma/tau
MLTGAAFNALLKTLEEPPLHGVIVLATTEYEKLPPTITSRTQRFLFKKLSKVMILEKLSRIAKEEGIKIEPGAMELIAAAGEGSLRDAESLLDQMRSSGKEIDLQAVERMTGRIGFKKVEELSALILKDDLAAALRYISSVSEEGQNLVQMTKDLIHYLRKILALKVSPGLEELFQMELTGEEIAAMKKLCALMDAAKGTRLLRALIRAYSEMRYSPFAGIPLEIVLTENLTASPNR